MNRSHELLPQHQHTGVHGIVGGRRGLWTWRVTAAVCGLAGGMLAALTGALLLTIAWFTGQQAGGLSLHGIGSGLLLATIPLLMLGAHCFDLSERRETSRQQAAQTGARAVANRHGQTRAGFAGAATLLLLLCGCATTTQAQQTIFNVPTTDVLPAGDVYVELDISAKSNDSEALNRFSSFVPRVVVGAGGRVEVGLNVTGNVQPGADATTLVPAVKWKVYDGGDNGWAIAVGDNVFIPVRNKSYDAGTYAYTMVQKTFASHTRVGAGGYFFSKNVVAPDANRAGGQFSVEQPVTDRFGLSADWFTGKHASGYFTAGGSYKLTKKLTGYAAYSIGNANASKGNHFFYFELGYNIN